MPKLIRSEKILITKQSIADYIGVSVPVLDALMSEGLPVQVWMRGPDGRQYYFAHAEDLDGFFRIGVRRNVKK